MKNITLEKKLSLNNGNSYLTAAEAMPEIGEHGLWEVVVEVMNDDIRETVHAELAPCTNEEFLQRYLQLAKDYLLIG